MYEGWEVDADVKAQDAQEGYDAMTQALAEDEQWAQYLHESFHGREY